MSRSASAALLALLAVFWGINWPILKFGVAEIPPWVFRTLTSTGGAVGLFALAWFSGLPLRVPSGRWWILVVCALLNITGWNILILYGVALMDSGRAAILAYTMPLWASLAGIVVLREQLTVPRALALVTGLGAMTLLFLAGDEHGSALGATLVVLAAMSWGFGTVAVKAAALAMPVVVLTAWQHAIGVVPIALVAVAWDWHNLGPVSAEGWFSLVYNMTITSVFCYWAYFRIVAAMPVVVSTVGTLMVPVIGVFASAWYFELVPATEDYLALALVVVSVALVMIAPRAKRAADA